MRLCWQVFAVAIIFLATPSAAESPLGSRPLLASNEAKPQEPDTDIFALMSGKCSTLRVAGRDFACRSVAFFHGEQGRTNFTVALDDPADNSHVISFSGENGRRNQDNLYELPIDRMLLSSKDRPKVDGLPVPFVEISAGICRQVGSFVTCSKAAGATYGRCDNGNKCSPAGAICRLSTVSCNATDRNGKRYELQFESDGSPMTVRRLRQYTLAAEKRRARQTEQFECRQKADAAKITPRDWTPYIIRCLAENGEKLAPTGQQ